MCNGMCIGMCNRMCIECAILFVVHIRAGRAFITGHVDSLQALRCISKRRSEQRGHCWSAQDLRDASVLMNMLKSSAVLLMCWRYKQTTTSASTVAGIIDARDDTCPSLPATPKSQCCWPDKLPKVKCACCDHQRWSGYTSTDNFVSCVQQRWGG